MSRIGSQPISLPQSVTITVVGREIVVKGPKGQLVAPLLANIEVNVENDQVTVTRKNDEKRTKAFHGLVRSLINNHVFGVTEGYKKTLKLIGTGYRVKASGGGLLVTVGFSHPVEIVPVEGVKITNEGNDTIHIEGIDKQLVGQTAANIRAIRPPEPYKGKGIRYVDEVVKRKAGKTAAAV